MPSPSPSNRPGAASAGSSTTSCTAPATIRSPSSSASSTTSAPTPATTLLPTLVDSLRDELRLDAVAIDLRVADGWRQSASTGPATAQRRVVPLVHRGEVVGRLVVGWSDGPALRERDEAILQQLVGPLSLAVGWVRLAEDLRRSSVAIVSAREEERRRLRRDLHDGLGPSLTGVSLGLRTALRQLDRRAGGDPGPAPRALLARVADEVDTAVADLKRIVRDLRPTALDQLGLMDAVAEFTRGFDGTLDITLALPSEPVRLPAAVEIADVPDRHRGGHERRPPRRRGALLVEHRGRRAGRDRRRRRRCGHRVAGMSRRRAGGDARAGRRARWQRRRRPVDPTRHTGARPAPGGVAVSERVFERREAVKHGLRLIWCIATSSSSSHDVRVHQ